ncbi:MAG: hypothetical protein JKY48_11915 [Flavobacteriales bacterium]|nr:hypothetical protein [Flavobacteriales bacterium]
MNRLISKDNFSDLSLSQMVIVVTEFGVGLGLYKRDEDTTVCICSVFDFIVEVHISQSSDKIIKASLF